MSESSAKDSAYLGDSNLDYSYNTEYGDDDIPEIDLPSSTNAVDSIPYEFPGKKSTEKK